MSFGSLAALTSPEALRAPRWLPWTAGGVPLAYFLAAASADPGPFEEGAFIAAARTLGVAHPPGAPLTTLFGSLFALLPVGSLSFRVAASCAVCASFTLALFSRALYFSLLGVGVQREKLAAQVALAATWFVAQTPLFLAQATRPNVYAAQFALALLVIDALVRFERSEPTDDRRTLYFGALVQGLAFANHHVFALLTLSVAAPTLGRLLARRGFLGLMPHVAMPILGFSAYVFVPIRGGRHPFVNLGDPSSLWRTIWVLGADPWWGPRELETPSTLAQLSRGLMPAHALTLALAALALVGVALAARAESQRRFASLWLIALLVPLASIALILEPKLDVDAYGALTPCALALVALSAFGVSLALARFMVQFERPFAISLNVLSLALLGSLALRAEVHATSERGREETPPLLATLPTRAVVIARDASTYFHYLGDQAEAALRADVAVVPLEFLEYPGEVERLAAASPELAPLLAQLVRDRDVNAESVRALAGVRPAFVAAHGALKPLALEAR